MVMVGSMQIIGRQALKIPAVRRISVHDYSLGDPIWPIYFDKRSRAQLALKLLESSKKEDMLLKLPLIAIRTTKKNTSRLWNWTMVKTWKKSRKFSGKVDKNRFIFGPPLVSWPSPNLRIFPHRFPALSKTLPYIFSFLLKLFWFG